MTFWRSSLLLLWSKSLLKVTGAAWNLFLVKTAAALQGISEEMKARSGFVVFPGFTPTTTPDARKPWGYVPEVGTYFFFAAGIVGKQLYVVAAPLGGPEAHHAACLQLAAFDQVTQCLLSISVEAADELGASSTSSCHRWKKRSS